MQFYLHKWLRIAILNLTIVSFIGIILRYKIAFSLPFIDQKQLLHGHSHFAFTGWVTAALMALMVAFLYIKGLTDAFKRYRWLLITNLISAYGMVLSFPVEGYGLFSISFSTLSVAVSYVFALYFWKDAKRLQLTSISRYWFNAACLFSVISSLGAFALSFMMAAHVIHQNWYLSSNYYYLHFQYNGWFFFACMGLIADKLELLQINHKWRKAIFYIFFLACFPAYFLSTLWMPLPVWLYVMVIMAALAQVVGWFMFLKIIVSNKAILNNATSKTGKVLLMLSAFACTVKVLLQTISVYPPISDLAFGFRPIVIGYLHLVLFGVITLGILGYMASSKFISLGKTAVTGIIIFVTGMIFNEIMLLMQGAEGMEYVYIPYSNELLLLAALIIFTGLVLFVTSQYKNKILNEANA